MKCISGKRGYQTEQIAEVALLQIWTTNDFVKDQGPISIYKCDDCGLFHFTSRPPMNTKLSQYLNSSRRKIDQAASKWTDKLN